MVVLKTSKELSDMKIACQLSAQALAYAGEVIKPGVSTAHVDKLLHEFIVSRGGKPNFLNYNGFPGSACISVNEEVIHGIPGGRILKEGDIVSVDIGAAVNGYNGDNAYTFPVGEISAEAQQLLDVTKECLKRGIEAAQPGNRIGDIGFAVQSYAESFGYGVVREYVGHGVGRKLHESPEVPNFGTPGRGQRLLPGMTIAIEPMINAKGAGVTVAKDGCVRTKSGSLSAHFEHTIAITPDGPVILTVC